MIILIKVSEFARWCMLGYCFNMFIDNQTHPPLKGKILNKKKKLQKRRAPLNKVSIVFKYSLDSDSWRQKDRAGERVRE